MGRADVDGCEAPRRPIQIRDRVDGARHGGACVHGLAPYAHVHAHDVLSGATRHQRP